MRIRIGNFFAPQDVKNKYRYNGKEFIEDFDIGLYDYGARWYDPAVGSFMSVDPMAEEYADFSPYVYVANNPIGNFDADGRSINNDYEVKKNKDGFTTTTKTGDTGGDTEDHITYKDENDKVTGKKTEKVQHVTVEGEIFSESRGPGYKIKMVGTKSPAIESVDDPFTSGDVLAIAGLRYLFKGRLWSHIMGVAKSEVDDVVKATVKSQADDIAQQVGKNSITINKPNGRMHYDLRGAQHKGVPTPHVQRSLKNINPRTSATFFNKDRKYVREMTQQDISILSLIFVYFLAK